MSINKDLPPCFFTSIFIGSKGSGKSYSLVKLSKNYETAYFVQSSKFFLKNNLL